MFVAGFITEVQILTAEECEILCGELSSITEAGHPRMDYWYTANPTFAANEKEPDTRLLHALGQWRVGVGFHDLLWAPKLK